MLPHLDTVIWLIILGALVYAVLAWFGIVFQNLLFQRYRMNKNEAALRKERVHQKKVDQQRYSNGLLGEIKGETEK